MATPFQSPAWLVPWWRQFGQPVLRVLAIRSDDALVGLLPFYIYRDPERGARQLLPLGVGTTDYLDGLFAPQCGDAEIREALRLLWGRASDWDEMVVPQLRPGSRLLAAAGPKGERFSAESCCRMPALRMGELPQKIRRNAMYYRNRAQRLGTLEYSVADASTWPAVFAALEQLHTERWQGRGEPGVLADPRVLAWHREALPLMLEQDMLRLGCLRLDGEPLAVLYSLVDPAAGPAARSERTQYFYITAFSAAHAELRPGTLLLAYAIEHAAEEGIATIDMLRGEEGYKQMWHLNRVPTEGIRLRRDDISALESEAA